MEVQVVDALIERVEVRILEVPLEKPFWMSQQAYSTAGQIFVTLHTRDGAVGYGQAHGNPMSEIVSAIEGVLAPVVIGRSVWSIKALWQDMFAVSNTTRERVVSGQPHFGGRGRHQLLAAISAVDIAMWDARSKLAGEPLWRFLGGEDPVLPAYATGGYYPNEHDSDAGVGELLDEVSEYAEAGFTGVKIKVGREPKSDLERAKAVRTAFPDLRLMVDANGGWNLADAVYAAQGFRDLDVFWLEEPLQWHYAPSHLSQLRHRTGLSLAAGEQEMHHWGAAELVDEAGISYLQTDCTRAGGLTSWMQAASYAELRGVAVAPHHDGHIHGHYLTTVAGEKYCETFPNATRDPLWAGLYERRPDLSNGQLTLTEDPGLGIEPDLVQLDKWTVHQAVVAR